MAAIGALEAVELRQVPLWLDALDGWFELLRGAAIDCKRLVGATRPEGVLVRWPRLADLVSAGVLGADELAQAALRDDAAGWLAVGRPATEWVDRWLVPDMLLGLCRSVATVSDAERALGVACVMAVDSYRPALDASLGPEALLEGPGCHVRPRWARSITVGRALAVRYGLEAVLRAYVGQGALPAVEVRGELAAADAAPLALSVQDGAADGARDLDEQEAAWIEDVVLACVWRRRLEQRDRHGHATRAVLWRGGGVHIDLHAAVVRPLDQGGLVHAGESGWVDGVIPPLPVPPRACMLAQAAGWDTADLRWQDPEDPDELIDAVFSLFSGSLAPADLVGDGFALRPGGT